jgi:hypothetical protein
MIPHQRQTLTSGPHTPAVPECRKREETGNADPMFPLVFLHSKGGPAFLRITPRRASFAKSRGLFQNRLMKAFPVVNPVKGDCITNTDIRRQFILAEHGLYRAFFMIVTSD